MTLVLGVHLETGDCREHISVEVVDMVISPLKCSPHYEPVKTWMLAVGGNKQRQGVNYNLAFS